MECNFFCCWLGLVLLVRTFRRTTHFLMHLQHAVYMEYNLGVKVSCCDRLPDCRDPVSNYTLNTVHARNICCSKTECVFEISVHRKPLFREVAFISWGAGAFALENLTIPCENDINKMIAESFCIEIKISNTLSLPNF